MNPTALALLALVCAASAFAPSARVRARRCVPAAARRSALAAPLRMGTGDFMENLSEVDEDADGSAVAKAAATLAPETTFYEGPPSWTECIIPFISILTVLGIIPFIATLVRQFWVTYKITSRRVSIQSGYQGKDEVQIIYPDVVECRFVTRMFGTTGDLVMDLRDGAKLEMRSIPNFAETYRYMLDQMSEDAQKASQSPPNFN